MSHVTRKPYRLFHRDTVKLRCGNCGDYILLELTATNLNDGIHDGKSCHKRKYTRLQQRVSSKTSQFGS